VALFVAIAVQVQGIIKPVSSVFEPLLPIRCKVSWCTDR
jgi:hypothetical protein